jgi:hypothetical protein
MVVGGLWFYKHFPPNGGRNGRNWTLIFVELSQRRYWLRSVRFRPIVVKYSNAAILHCARSEMFIDMPTHHISSLR